MQCPKCGSQRVEVAVTTLVKSKTAHHGVLWWLLVGWWWVPVKWVFFTVPALLFAIFGHRRQKVVSKQVVNCVCQDCGHVWRR